MNLSVFTFKTIQESRTLLNVMKSHGVSDLNDCVVILEDIIKKEIGKSRASKGRPNAINFICPECGSRMHPVANPDGLKIIGCKQCRYSKLVK